MGIMAIEGGENYYKASPRRMSQSLRGDRVSAELQEILEEGGQSHLGPASPLKLRAGVWGRPLSLQHQLWAPSLVDAQKCLLRGRLGGSVG